MFDLTVEERKVVLFLVFAALAGLGVNYLVKINKRLQPHLEADLRIAKLNLNQAGLEEILDTDCVPRKIAGNIIEYRKINGDFSSIEQLKEIKGIKGKRFSKLEKLFFVE